MTRTSLFLLLSLALGAQDSVVGPSPRPGAVADAASSAAKPWAGRGAGLPEREIATTEWWKRHLADTALHATGTALDAASSWGQREANPILRSADGRFGAQGAMIKSLSFAGMEFAKWKLARRYPRSKLVRAISLAPAAAFGGVAARNWRAR